MCMWLTSWSYSAASSHACSGASPGTPEGFPVPPLFPSCVIAPSISVTQTGENELICADWVYSITKYLFWPKEEQPVSGRVPLVKLWGKWYHLAQCACQTGCEASHASPGRWTIQSHSCIHSRIGCLQRCTCGKRRTGDRNGYITKTWNMPLS